MALNFLALPKTSTLSIVSFLDLRSCVRLRMMSKQAKNVIDEYILCINSCVTKIDIEPTDSDMKFEFGFLSNKFYAQWKIWLIRQSAIYGFEFEAKVPILIAKVKLRELEKFCELLKSLHRVTFEIFEAPNGEDLNRVCCDFLEGKSVRIITTCGISIQRAKAEFQDRNSLMYVIRRLKPEGFRYRPFVLDADTINFMEEVANSVEWMHAELYKCQDGHSIPPIARSILSRKCDFLTMSAASFSAADAESIVQFLHRSKKKVHFEVVADDHGIRAEMDVGLYNVKFESERITIKHRDRQPLFP